MASIFTFEGQKDGVVFIKGLDPKLTFEELRNRYDDCTPVRKLKLLSTNDQEMIAAFQFENLEAQFHGLARAFLDGFFTSKEAFVIGDSNPLMNKIINTQTRLRIRYPLEKVKEPQEFKESLLQLLSKVGGYYKIKKDHILANKQELIVLIESNFTLGKLTTGRSFEHRGISVSLEYLIDRISHEKLKQLLNPQHLTFDPNDLHRSKLFHLLLDILYPSWNSDAVKLESQANQAQSPESGSSGKEGSIFSYTVDSEDDKLEDLFEESNEDHPEYGVPKMISSAEPLKHFSPENTMVFLSRVAAQVSGWPALGGRSPSQIVAPQLFKAALLLKRMRSLRGSQFYLIMEELRTKLTKNKPDQAFFRKLLATLENKCPKFGIKDNRLRNWQGDSDWGEPSTLQSSAAFGSEELWKILQSCDPEWREFIWKYRTLEFTQESMQQQSLYSRNRENNFIMAEKMTAYHNFSVEIPESWVSIDASKTARVLEVEDSLQVTRAVYPPVPPPTQPAVCPTPAASQPAQSRPPGEDRWISQHLESNLRFNRMVSPILWR